MRTTNDGLVLSGSTFARLSNRSLAFSRANFILIDNGGQGASSSNIHRLFDDDAEAPNGQTPISSEFPVAEETNYHARSSSGGLQIAPSGRHRDGIVKSASQARR
jgi:hypothetical protein